MYFRNSHFRIYIFSFPMQDEVMLCERISRKSNTLQKGGLTGMPCSVHELSVSAYQAGFKRINELNSAGTGTVEDVVYGIEGWAIVEGLNVSTTVSGTKPYFTCSVVKPRPPPPPRPYPAGPPHPLGGPIPPLPPPTTRPLPPVL